MNSQWDRVNSLLDAVMGLPADQRESFLTTQCKDPAVLKEVRSLLRAQLDAQSFLETPAKDYAATLLSGDRDSGVGSLVGYDIDGYRILDMLGQGGMGVVYKAKNLTLDRVEALKVITPNLVKDDQFVRRFKREAQAMAKIHQANIVTIYALRPPPPSPLGHYITMEFVEGQTLADTLIDQGAISWRKALPIIKQLLAAFEFAHERGIIHRDIKPRNIMLTPKGVAKVMDFGLAKFYMRDDVTQTQGVSGTLYYMSPEQVKGEQALDQRSDIFSLGMTMYEMLSGRLPFEHSDSQFRILRSIVEDPFPTPSEFNAGIPQRLSKIIMKALEKRPKRRYQHARDMLRDIEIFEREALRPAAGGDTVTVKRRTTTLRVAALGDDKKWVKYVVVVALLGLLTWGGFALLPGLFSSDAGPGTEGAPTGQTEEVIASTQQGVDPPAQNLGADSLGQGAEGTPPAFTEEALAEQQTPTPEETGTPPPQTPAAMPTQTTQNPPTQASTPEVTPRETTQPVTDTQADPASNSTTTDPPPQQEEDPPQQEETQTEEAGTPDPPVATTEETPTPAAPGPTPMELVQGQGQTLVNDLRRAILEREWGSLPKPLADYYDDALKGLYRRFRFEEVNNAMGAVRTEGSTLVLPVRLFVDYKQRGRDQTRTFPIPAEWIWADQGGTLQVIEVRKVE